MWHAAQTFTFSFLGRCQAVLPPPSPPPDKTIRYKKETSLMAPASAGLFFFLFFFLLFCLHVFFLQGAEWKCIFYGSNWHVLNGVKIQEHDKENTAGQEGSTTHLVGNIAFPCCFHACKQSAALQTLENIVRSLDISQMGQLIWEQPIWLSLIQGT